MSDSNVYQSTSAPELGEEPKVADMYLVIIPYGRRMAIPFILLFFDILERRLHPFGMFQPS